jgi:hypothetical protein
VSIVSVSRRAGRPQDGQAQLRHVGCQHESEPGPAELPCDRRIGLREGLEQAIKLLGVHADAAVTHRHAQQPLSINKFFPGRQRYPAAPRELAGVRGQIVEALLEAHAVSADRVPECVNFKLDEIVVPGRQRTDGRKHLLEYGACGNLLNGHIHASGLDL